jgi:hypothetical protein
MNYINSNRCYWSSELSKDINSNEYIILELKDEIVISEVMIHGMIGIY